MRQKIQKSKVPVGFEHTTFRSCVHHHNHYAKHPAESSENTSIAKIRKYVPIDCLWQMFS